MGEAGLMSPARQLLKNDGSQTTVVMRGSDGDRHEAQRRRWNAGFPGLHGPDERIVITRRQIGGVTVPRNRYAPTAGDDRITVEHHDVEMPEVLPDPAHVLLGYVGVEYELRPAFPEHGRSHVVQIRPVGETHNLHCGTLTVVSRL
jgi:hypothetical protein